MVAPVFTPFFGFSRISAPKINAEVETFKDGTFLYQRSVIKGAAVQPVTFERAASMFDSDFYDWMAYAIYGQKVINDGAIGSALQGAGLSDTTASALAPGIRRNLVILHFSSINPGASSSNSAVFDSLNTAIEGLSGIGPFEFAARIPARAWLLHNCMPTSYTSGSDFDATTGAISVMALDVQPEWIEEFSFGLKP